MVEIVRGDKTLKMPGNVVAIMVLTAGLCAIASDVCNVIIKRK